MKRGASLEDIDAALERWHRRLTRAVNAIDKLRAQRKRLLRSTTATERSARRYLSGRDAAEVFGLGRE